MRARRWHGFLALIFVGLAQLALAQPRPSAPDPAFLAAKQAFEAYNLEERRAIQSDLTWLADFNGTASGEFGRLTYEALRRLDAIIGKPVRGVLTPIHREALAVGAATAKKELDFALVTDPVSRMRIGIPRAILTKRSTGPSGLPRWQDKAEQVTLDFTLGKPEDKLEQLFERGTANTVPGRKISYKLLRPDFFVISGETPTGKFYRRLEKGPDGTLRGFSIGYDKSRKFEWVMLGMIASFEAIPGSAPVTAGAAAASSATPGPRTGIAAVPPARRVTAISLGGGRYVTVLAPLMACKSLSREGGTLDISKRDEALGLALLSAGPTSESVVFSAGEAGEGLLLQRDLSGALVMAPAKLSGARVNTPLQPGGAGAALVDRRGSLLGLVAEEPRAAFQVAGVVPMLSYRLVPVREIAAFAGVALAPQSGEALAMSAISAKLSPSLLSVTCRE